MNGVAQPWQKWLPYVAAGALIVGILARFKGLGSAPFSVDEYYLSQSISSVLVHGVPAFDCGGYYMRGLILQYLSAGLRLAGLSAELAPRLICTLCSLIALPAAYLLGRRMQGRLVGILTVAILALSVWEIEMARFGRMYAPFQAVFLWYLVFFLRYTVERNARALWPMLILSIAGPLVWEGGIFLLLANLLPVFLRPPAERVAPREYLYLAVGAVLLALAYWFLRFDFRGINNDSLPTGFNPALTHALIDPVSTLNSPLSELPHHPGWLIAGAIPLLALVMALRWIWTLRSQPLLALGLVAALLAAVAHQFLLAGAVVLLLPLMRYIRWNDLTGRPARTFQLALLALAVFWLAFGIMVIHWHDPQSGGAVRGLAMLGYQFMKLPDFVGVVVRPWVWAIPHLGGALLLLCTVAIYRMAKSDAPFDSERVLLVTFLVLLLAASASHPPRQETRYVFFLYPLAIIIALTTVVRAVALLAQRPSAVAGVTTVIALGGFALTEDFQPHHLRHIDSNVETFRLGMSPAMQSHLVIRDDYRALASWLQQHVAGNTTVINGVHGLDRYYPGFSHFYVDENSPNFPDWSCHQGTVERWGNYPLVYSVGSLASAIGAGSSAYLVTFGYDSEALLQSLATLHPQIATSQGAIIIIELRG